MVVGAGDGYVDVPVTLSAPSTTNITVNANSSNGTAIGSNGAGTGVDFLCPYSSCNSGTVTFAPGQTTATLRVELLEDLSASGNESFTVNLSGQSSNATLARASTRVNIVNNEVIVATPALSVRSATVDASAGTVNVPVVLGGLFGEASNSTVTVNYTTVDGSATAGTDYAQKSGTLSFAPGETVKNIPVSLLDPAGSAPARSFSIQLSSPTNATIADATGTVVIGAHGGTVQAQPLISLGPDMVVGAGDGYVDVPVTLSAPSNSIVTVSAYSSNGTAIGSNGAGTGVDFLCPYSSCNSGTVTFAPGQTTATLRVVLLQDLSNVSQRSFTVNLSGPTGGTVARGAANITITSDEITPTAASSVVATPSSVPADGLTQTTITVTLSNSSGNAVADKIVNLTASAGSHAVISSADQISNGLGQVIFESTDTTPESVQYQATDATDNVTLSGTPSVVFVPTTLGLLESGATLGSGQSLASPNGQYKLVMQGDGNLVEYFGSTVVWASGSSGAGATAVMQGDGNLVVYNAAKAPVFATGTSGHSGAYLVLGDDGELEVTSGSTPFWATPGILVQGATLGSGQSLASPNGQYKLVMQGDGNLVEYFGSTVVWASGSSGAGATAVMQGDGNLVVYNAAKAPVFATGTSGHSGAYLVLGDDGELEVTSGSTPFWATPGILVQGATLGSGQSLASPNGQYKLVMQGDGNLVEYFGSTVVWASGSSGAGATAVMQGDGNLVVYNAAKAPVFATGTSGHSGAYLVLGDDGELEVTSGSTPFWATPGILVQGATLGSGQSLASPNGQYKLVMQGDGNLVEYFGSTVVWASGSSGAGATAVMQGDGNLVVYNAAKAPVFATGTSGHSGAYLVLGDDGTVDIDGPNSQVFWTEP